MIQRYKLKLVGIHMHIGSGVDYAHLEQVCGAMVRQVIEFDQDLEAISAGGGLSIPYREGEEAIDTNHYFDCGTLRVSRLLNTRSPGRA